jgi:hypothetical protein
MQISDDWYFASVSRFEIGWMKLRETKLAILVLVKLFPRIILI